MQVEANDFLCLKDSVEFLEPEFLGNEEIVLSCFMATDETYWNEIPYEEGFTDKGTIRLMHDYLGIKRYPFLEFICFLDFVCRNPFFLSAMARTNIMRLKYMGMSINTF